MLSRSLVWILSFILLLSAVSALTHAQSVSASASFSLGERITCQTAIEEVYWRHRESGGTRPSFDQSVPRDVVQRKAEDTVLKSLALEQFWGVTITGVQLQAELDRMAANSRTPDVLAELFAALDNDPEKAAECLARPLLVDRLIQTYYSSDERFHGNLKSRAQAELAAGPLRNSSGQYHEVEWQRGQDSTTKPGVIQLEPSAFEERVRDLKRSMGGASGNFVLGRTSGLREDSGRFYAISVISLDNARARVASVEWPKISFDAWWSETRQQLPMTLSAASYSYTLPLITPNANCRDDSWKPTLQLLDARYFHTAVWTGTEMIVWGGMNSVGTIYSDGSRYNPATDTWALTSAKGAPSAREAHVAVWTGREMVIFGGTGDKTGGRYDPVTDTWRATSTAGAPIGQQYSAVVWTGREMMVWGGILGSPVNTGGRYNPQTNTWAAMATAPLAPRAYMPAVWTGTEMIVWAGYDVTIGQLYNDGARYDPATNTWKKTPAAGAPNARYWHTAVWTGTEMIVWGGINSPTYDLSGGRYNPTTNTWTPTSLANPPSLRWLHAAVWTGTKMVIQGGSPGDRVGGRYDPTTDSWTSTNPLHSPTNGQGLTAVWTGRELILWGGLDESGVFHNDGGRYNPVADRWRPTSTMNVPAPRGLAVTVWTGTDAIFWGGDPDGFSTGTGGRYNPATDSWKLTSLVNAPNQRYGHTSVWTGTEMVVFGGVGADNIASRYNPATDAWFSATSVNAPIGRDHHGAVWTGSEMIVWGGFIYSFDHKPTGGRYNPATDTWKATSISGSPDTRMWPVSVWSGTEAIFWGGLDGTFGNAFNDGGRYNPVTNMWTRTTQTGAPGPRITQGVWTGSEMLIWGGSFDSSGGRYNPATDSWKPTTKVNAPFERGGGRWSTVWTGSQMIIWGGVIETQKGNLYCASGTPNMAPVASDDSYSVAVNSVLAVRPAGTLANDSDGNSDLLTAKALTSTTHGILQFNSNGSFRYKPANGFNGTDTFTYQSNDGLANSNIATVSIVVQ